MKNYEVELEGTNMKNEYTDITVILDRSGSMGGKEQFVKDGFNEFIKEQQQDQGKVLVSAVQFDSEYEKLFEGVNVGSNPEVNLKPRGMTALYDAIGKTINETGERLSKLKEADRPDNVIFLIITDGQENNSQEFTAERVKKMIEHQESKYSWQFIYLGSNQDAIVAAKEFGIKMDTAATYGDNDHGNSKVWEVSSRMVNTYKSVKGMSFTDDERSSLLEDTNV